jgi:hypothetical protein
MTNKLAKHQIKQLDMIEVYLANDMRDTAARSISSLIRSASNCVQQSTLRAIAIKHNLHTLPEFIA